ncbi:FAD-binding oxidoreductase [Pararhodobacter sp.]|uniref:FAD-binding oxidoreductase n=1 Tax=Pararhodobacter sp. TaxID=2127056 RepID=UPI002FDCBC64
MDQDTRRFIEQATLLFIASRNAAGALDVSPRGGLPSVVRVNEDGRLLLPDYRGNRRLDTLGNVLARPEVALILLNRGAGRFLRLQAKAEISLEPKVLAAFPADENPPCSVMVLTPGAMQFVDSTAFSRAGFWLDPQGRKAPLDLMTILSDDFRRHAQAGRKPVMKDEAEEALLQSAGLREHYTASSEAVATKVYASAEAGTQAFIAEASFIVLAREAADGAITMDLTGEGPLRDLAARNWQGFALALPPALPPALPQADAPPRGECGLLAIAPGRSEALRVNGLYEDSLDQDSTGQGRALTIAPREIYFHCSAALSRSRIWAEARQQPWFGQRRFICTARQQESPDVMSFLLRPQDEAPVGRFEPGQYVTVSLPGDSATPPRKRAYSLSGQPDAQTLQVTVRRLGKGGLSDALHEKLVPGAEALLGVPAGQFVLSPAPERPVILVSAGIGVTPLLPMLERLAQSAGAPVWFVHGARDKAHHVFAARSRAIADSSKRPVTLVTAFSRAEGADSGDGSGDRPGPLSGRLDAAMIAALAPVAEADIYLCGPEAFMETLRAGLTGLGADAGRIRTERFLDQGALAAGMAGRAAGRPGAAVTFARSRRTLNWTPASGSILDLALAHGLDIAYSCRLGDCQTCVQRVVSGAAEHLGATDIPLGPGQAMLCQAVPRGDLTLDC